MVYAQIKQMVSIIGVFFIYPKTRISEPLHWKLHKISTKMKISHKNSTFTWFWKSYMNMIPLSSCYAPCRSDTNSHRPTRLRSDPVGPPSATLGTPGTALHNLSQDTGDLLTSLSFLLYLLIFPMPRSDYLPRVFLMFSLIYFCSSSGSSINYK